MEDLHRGDGEAAFHTSYCSQARLCPACPQRHNLSLRVVNSRLNVSFVISNCACSFSSASKKRCHSTSAYPSVKAVSPPLSCNNKPDSPPFAPNECTAMPVPCPPADHRSRALPLKAHHMRLVNMRQSFAFLTASHTSWSSRTVPSDTLSTALNAPAGQQRLPHVLECDLQAGNIVKSEPLGRGALCRHQ